MDLKDAILLIPPREQSGSEMADRVAYQIDWVLSKIIELHKTDDDYLIVLEHQDDVIVLDSETNPTTIEFYQVKTKDGKYWLLSELLFREVGEKGLLYSIIGKLYGGKIKFPKQTKSLNLLSNARYQFDLNDKTPSLPLTEIRVDALTAASIAKITTQLISEYSLTDPPEFSDITYFRSADLSLKDHSTHTRGKLGDYLNDRYPMRKFNTKMIYTVLSDELKRRNNRKFEEDSFVELVKQKAVSRRTFDQALTQIGIKRDLDEAWNSIEAQLRQEGMSLKQILRLKQEWRQCELDRMNPTNDVMQELAKKVRVCVSDYHGSDPLQTLLDSIIPQCGPATKPTGLISVEYLSALILMEFYEQQHQQI
jgi:hypothetical protein